MTTEMSSTSSPTSTSPVPEESQILGIMIGVLVPFVIILVCIIIVTICLAGILLVTRRKKATIRNLQLDVLTRSVCGSVVDAMSAGEELCIYIAHKTTT